MPLPLSPQIGQVIQLFLDVKYNVFLRLAEPNNNNYDNDGSKDYNYNFGCFDTKKYTQEVPPLFEQRLQGNFFSSFWRCSVRTF